jgi:phosphopantetheine--protein transferase-like protein
LDVGIDIVEINRFLDLCINYDLESIIFTQEEMSESIQRKAGYFAAKESVLKCLPPNVIIDFSFFRKIQIIKYRNGKPLVEFTDKYLQEQLKDWNFNLSISHDGDYAVAIAARNPRE